jgi:hypothetical protein
MPASGPRSPMRSSRRVKAPAVAATGDRARPHRRDRPRRWHRRGASGHGHGPNGKPAGVYYEELPALLLAEVRRQHQALRHQAGEFRRLRERLMP